MDRTRTRTPRRHRRLFRPLAVAALSAGLLGVPGTIADGTPGAPSVPVEALGEARARRVATEARVSTLDADLAAARTRLERLTAKDRVLEEQLVESRRTMREYAVDMYVLQGTGDWVESLADPRELAQFAWATEMLDARSAAAADAAAQYQALRADTRPEVLAAGERVDELATALAEARADLVQAAALERDAELAAQRAEAARLAAVRRAEEERRSRERAAAEAQAAQAARAQAAAAPAAPARNAPARAQRPAAGAPATTTTGPAPAPPAPPAPSGPTPTPAEAATLAKIRQCESGGNYQAVSPSGRYRGAYQFDRGTWASVGGTGDPAAASPAEQDLRALILLRQRGTRPWPHCGR